MDDEDGGLLNISISDGEEQQPAKPSRRTDQSETEWQVVKDAYSPKVENGEVSVCPFPPPLLHAPRARNYPSCQREPLYQSLRQIHKSVVLPLGSEANKQHVQQALHAVEELYFFRRYQEAADLAAKILDEGGLGDSEVEIKALLEKYKQQCRRKLS
jgi:hypothetical protein